MAVREVSTIVGTVKVLQPTEDVYGGYATILANGRDIRAFVPPPLMAKLTVGGEYRGQLILENGEFRLVHVYSTLD